MFLEEFYSKLQRLPPGPIHTTVENNDESINGNHLAAMFPCFLPEQQRDQRPQLATTATVHGHAGARGFNDENSQNVPPHYHSRANNSTMGWDKSHGLLQQGSLDHLSLEDKEENKRRDGSKKNRQKVRREK